MRHTLPAGVDLLAIVQKDAQLKRVATTNGGEWAGPCPFCGGDDRFRLWPQHPSGHGRWWCRRCDRSGDAIAYLQARDGLSFRQAVEALGGDLAPARASTPHRRAPPSVPDVEPPGATWQARARAFCQYARRQLWSADGRGARAYLSEVRGLREDTVRRFGLGYNPQCLYDRPVSRWGLSGSKAVYLSRGIVIPCALEGVPWYVQVRRPLEGGPLLAYLGGGPAVAWRPAAKYMAVKGSAGKALFGGDRLAGKDVLLFCEGEFDAMLAWQELRDLVDVVTLGGASKGNRGLPGRWHLRLLHYQTIVAAYDADGAGRSGAAMLAQCLRRVVQAAVPTGGDLTGFWRAGGDLRAWLNAQARSSPSRREGRERMPSP
jgi:DNA primase